jgi:hypothetical protein
MGMEVEVAHTILPATPIKPPPMKKYRRPKISVNLPRGARKIARAAL